MSKLYGIKRPDGTIAQARPGKTMFEAASSFIWDLHEEEECLYADDRARALRRRGYQVVPVKVVEVEIVEKKQ